jgi:hypothetical protein
LEDDKTPSASEPGSNLETLKALFAASGEKGGAIELLLQLSTLGEEMGRLIEERSKTLSVHSLPVEAPNNSFKGVLGIERDALTREDVIQVSWKINGFSQSAEHRYRVREVPRATGLDVNRLNHLAAEIEQEVDLAIEKALDKVMKSMRESLRADFKATLLKISSDMSLPRHNAARQWRSL